MISIRLAIASDHEPLFDLFALVKAGLRANGLDQWPAHYPDQAQVATEIAKQEVYVMLQEEELIGSLTLNQDQAEEYQQIEWTFAAEAPYIVHRLVIAPAYWGQGLGKRWMLFAEETARNKGGDVIRLDTWEENTASNKLYERLGYQLAQGSCYFYGPEKRFVCFEKKLNSNEQY